MKTSGWCQVAPGTAHTKRQHDACRGVCGCPHFGGHVGAQVGSKQGDSSPNVLASKVAAWDNVNGPSRAVDATRPGPNRPSFSNNERG